MIQHIKVENFKSLAATSVSLSNVAVLIGNNGAGKSSFFRALSFLSDLVTNDSINSALQAQNADFNDLVNLKATSNSIEFEARLVGSVFNDSGEQSGVVDARFNISVRKRKFVYINEERLLPWSAGQNPDIGKPGDIKFPYAIVRYGKREMYAHEAGCNPITYSNAVMAHSMLRDVQQTAYMTDGYNQISAASRQLRGFKHFEIWGPEALRTPAVRRYARNDLNGDGSNIANVLFQLRRYATGHFEQLLSFMRATYQWLADIQFKDVGQSQISLIFVEKSGLKQNAKSKRYNANQVSDGFLRMLALATLRYGRSRPTTIAYEEPENGLHPRMIVRSAILLREIAASGTQVLISTHSPLFLNAIFEGIPASQVIDELRLVTRGKSGETKISAAKAAVIEDAMSVGLGVGELWATLLGEEDFVS